MPVKETIDYFSQYGPWALLAILLLIAGGGAIWRVYLRMATALDRMHEQTIAMSERHSAEMRDMVSRHIDEIKTRDDRMIEVVDNNTKAITTFADRVNATENRLAAVEKALDRMHP